MPKQIKIGYDKVPSPVTTQFPQLVDIQGSRLFDAAGNPLRTQEPGFLDAFNNAENSLSLVANNIGKKESIPVVEQFPDSSEVSLTLLGVPRAEEQLSLFSDVAVYGLDEENWNFYTYDSNWNYPFGWYYRNNPTFGQRGSPEFVEESTEQALYLKTFPVPYTYPFGPKWTNDTPSSNMKAYMNFIAVGQYLYNQYINFEPRFAKDNFIGPEITLKDLTYNDITILGSDFVANGEFSQMNGSGNYHDVFYGDDEAAAYDQIERWTLFWKKITTDIAQFPLSQDGSSRYETTREYRDLRTFLINESRPGNSTTAERFGILESKRSFRYQPGRVSGFTYGIRMNTDPSSLANFVEWGASNSTDEYMFQLRGIELNIVRRSTIPLPVALLERMGLTADDQKQVYPVSLDSENQLWETIIPRSKWTGDALDGGGASRYSLNLKNVTMFKIEFSWYGAIGAKFYAYIPTGNGDCRWVLMHTLVIENGLEEPILQNPDFKFKYLLYSADTTNMNEPVYVYKYGSSYYIDGGDEGTLRLTSNSGDTKSFTNGNAVMGILPKNSILNSEGIPVDNNRKTYPSTVSVNSSADVRIDLEEITGSPDGIHYVYSSSLSKGIGDTSETLTLKFSEDGSSLAKSDDSAFTASQLDAKIIADGVYNIFTSPTDDATVAQVKRRNASFGLSNGVIGEETRKYDGTTFTPRDGTSTFSGRLSKYSIAASTTPIYANEFKIHWLNPNSRDTSPEKAEYYIGLSYEAPGFDANGDLKFGTLEEDYDIDKVMHVEWCDTGVIFDTINRESRSAEGGTGGSRLQTDFRLERPFGDRSGNISAIKGFVDIQNFPIETTVVDNGDGTFRLNFTSGLTPPIDPRDVGVAEVGINRVVATKADGVTPVKYTSIVQYDNAAQKYYVNVDFDISVGGTVNVTHIQSKTLKIEDDWQLNSFTQSGGARFTEKKFTLQRALRFNIQPLYLIVGLRDNANVNNIIVEEITPETISTFTPSFITEDSAISVVNTAGSSDIEAPSAFNSDDRLSSIRFDTTTRQPLRRPADKSNVIYSFYVGANTPQLINLENIFGQDRKGVTPGLLNNKAVFFTATGVDGGGNVEMTLTVKEQ